MARRKIKSTKFGVCEVAIFRDSYANEFVVQESIRGKITGGKASGGYFTDDKKDARNTAAAMVRRLRQRRVCR